MEISDRETAKRFDAVLGILGREKCETEHAAQLMDMLRLMAMAAALAMQPDAFATAGASRSRDCVVVSVMLHRDMLASLRSFAAANQNCETIVEAIAFILGAYLAEHGHFRPPVMPRA